MRLRAEISTWSDNTKNGVYLTDDSGDKCFAFARHGSSELKYFKNPITIDTRHRQFIDLYKFDAENEGVKVAGSKPGVYYTVLEGRCSCPGFKFRGFCKHVEKAPV